MAGQLITGTIVDENGKPVDLTGQEGAKVRCTYSNWSVTEIVSSLNCSSLTDFGTGYATINFISALSDVNYSAPTAVGERAGGGNRVMGIIGSSGGIAQAANGVSFRTMTIAGTNIDVDIASFTAFGRLA